jgi:hypothetical protein
MDALLVFPYFLVKLFTRLGAESGIAEWSGAILSSICLVLAMMAPFHPRDGFKVSMVGISWLIIVMAALSCVWECKEADRAAGSRDWSESARSSAVPTRHVVDLGEA